VDATSKITSAAAHHGEAGREHGARAAHLTRGNGPLGAMRGVPTRDRRPSLRNMARDVEQRCRDADGDHGDDDARRRLDPRDHDAPPRTLVHTVGRFETRPPALSAARTGIIGPPLTARLSFSRVHVSFAR